MFLELHKNSFYRLDLYENYWGIHVYVLQIRIWMTSGKYIGIMIDLKGVGKQGGKKKEREGERQFSSVSAAS